MKMVGKEGRFRKNFWASDSLGKYSSGMINNPIICPMASIEISSSLFANMKISFSSNFLTSGIIKNKKNKIIEDEF